MLPLQTPPARPSTPHVPILAAVLFLFVLASLMPALGQVPPAAEPPAQTEEAPADALGRVTPRGTLNGFLEAVGEKDYAEAARYLDLSGLPRGQQGRGPELARSLERLLDNRGWTLAIGAVSDDPEGDLGDDFPEDTDAIAYVRASGGNIPVTVRHVRDPGGDPIWLISRDFAMRIPALTQDLRPTPIDRIMTGALDELRIFGAGIGHWLAMLLLYFIFFLLAGLAIRGLIRFVRWLFRLGSPGAEDERLFIDKLETPLRVFLMVWLAGAAAFFLGISVIVRQAFMPIGATIGWIAAGVFFWHLSDVIVSRLEQRMAGQERFDMTSILGFARRMLKVLFIALIIILVLDSYGVNVTAGLAALGIGGIALALGAQKTLENFIGSLSIIADRPLHIGDFCRIGEVSGVVVDIGMRSTRLRTNEQTLVTIPNGVLSTQMIENFARRERFLLNRRLILRYDATADQIRDFVKRLDDLLASTDSIVQEPMNVRLLGFTEAGYAVEIWAFVDTEEFHRFLQVQAELTYGVMEAAQAAGVYFAVPAQTLIPARAEAGREGPAEG